MYVNADGTVLPCCVADHHLPLGNTQHASIDTIWNDTRYKNLRQKMIKGETCAECKSCYRNEESGIKSFRQSINQQYSKYIPTADDTNADGSLDSMNLRHFDVRWSNICNFKCRSCSSTYSSSWATEDNASGANKKVFIFAGGENNDSLYDQFVPHFSNIEEFYFAGGEPLLTDKHYDILEYLISINKTSVKLRYNTNLSNLKYKNKSVIELWKNFSNVEVYASLDSWGARAEYIREGTVWTEIEDNIRLIRKEAPHVNLQMSSVISAFNVYMLPEFLDYLFDQKLFEKSKFYPSFYNLINPGYYSSSILNDTIKGKIINKLSTVKYTSYLNTQIKNVIQYLETSKFNIYDKNDFIKHTNNFDTIRKKTFIEVFPELTDLIQ
jgi:MoaA/NifB/PqqE/SkfB family radical SAM enzyme